MGNPEIWRYAKNQTGPKTPEGKLRASLNARKKPIKDANAHTSANSKGGGVMDLKGESMVTKLMKEAGVDFSKPKEAIEKRNLFEVWLRSFTGDGYTEIQKLDSVIQILDTDMSQRVMKKLENGVPLSEADTRLIRLLKESLESLHRMKFGDKKTNVNVSYKDIREMMFADSGYGEGEKNE